jgi:hypothetical protein
MITKSGWSTSLVAMPISGTSQKGPEIRVTQTELVHLLLPPSAPDGATVHQHHPPARVKATPEVCAERDLGVSGFSWAEQ